MILDDLQGRILNWKFGQALKYKKALKKMESVRILEYLDNFWGDTGWTRTTSQGAEPIIETVIEALVQSIAKSEGWSDDWQDDEVSCDVI